MTHTTAFTTSMLAWSILAFPQGYQKGKVMGPALEGVRWGADYLLKTFRPDPKAKSPGGLIIVYQVLRRPPLFPSLPSCSQARFSFSRYLKSKHS